MNRARKEAMGTDQDTAVHLKVVLAILSPATAIAVGTQFQAWLVKHGTG
ncbi:hypothetical protein X975_17907, partial [Stegodyphus mimosarum]